MTEKKRSRQQEWQLKQQKEGKCCICGEPLFTKWNCKKHAKAQRDKARAHYRKKVGLDVNAPLIKTGRKRTEEVVCRKLSKES